MGVKHEIDLQALWKEYEGVAMHFNDLLIKLRTQSLAGIAAVSALVGIFSKDGGPDLHLDWVVAEAIFAAMLAFWLAIWCLDMLYYNRLLSGAVKAIIALESRTTTSEAPTEEINLSTMIEAEFKAPVWSLKNPRFGGVVAFYAIVFGVLIAGFIFAHHHAEVAASRAANPCMGACPS
jgi:hypothetical protein